MNEEEVYRISGDFFKDRAIDFLSFNDWFAEKEHKSQDYIIVARFVIRGTIGHNGSDYRTFSCLASIDDDSLKRILSTEDWDILLLGDPLGFGWPRSDRNEDGNLQYNSGQIAIINEVEFRPFTIYHPGEDYTIHHFELIQNFLLFTHAHYDSKRHTYVRFNDDDEIEAVAKCKVEDDRTVSISVNAHILRQYLAANRSYLVRYHDHRRWSTEDISSQIGKFKKSPIEIDSGIFELWLRTDIKWEDQKSSSRLLGKDIIHPYADLDYTHIDFVYGETKKDIDKSSFFEALKIIQSMGKNMERQAASYHKMSESQLRDVMIDNLNTHNIGYATGETFNVRGKTDIFMHFGNNHPFIAECKIWDGASKYKKAITQLFKYLSVREEEGVIITFFKGREFSTTNERAVDAIKSDPSYIQESWNTQQAGYYGTALHKNPNDSKKQVRLHHLFVSLT